MYTVLPYLLGLCRRQDELLHELAHAEHQYQQSNKALQEARGALRDLALKGEMYDSVRVGVL